jgi:HSP20 family protein
MLSAGHRLGFFAAPQDPKTSRETFSTGLEAPTRRPQFRATRSINLTGGAEMFGSLTNFDSLFEDFRRLEQEMDDLFGRSAWPSGIRSVARGTFPPLNVGATADGVDVYLFAAGMDPKSLDLSIQQNLLTVSGEREVPANENATYYRRERYSGPFRRVIALPDDVDPDRVDAKYRDGVLQITVQRRETAKPRQIEIK